MDEGLRVSCLNLLATSSLIYYRWAWMGGRRVGSQSGVLLYGAPSLGTLRVYQRTWCNEPWGQMQPVRHILGALLHEQGEIEEAEAVYRADIKLWKDNMWGLLGLKLCLEARGDAPEELAEVTALFNERSSRADIMPAKTCFCAQNSVEKTCCD